MICGVVRGSDAFDGWTTNNAFFTPQEFFGEETATTSVCALDADGAPQSVMPSGHWITFPEIAGGVGVVRQRYPIFPVADDGVPAFKEIKALEHVFLSDDYEDGVDGVDLFGDSRDLLFGFTVYLQGGGHEHEIYIAGWRVRSEWFDEENDRYFNDTARTIEVDSGLRHGHTHTLSIGRWRASEESPWRYVVGRCRFGSISLGDHHHFDDDDYLDGQCADLHHSIVRK